MDLYEQLRQNSRDFQQRAHERQLADEAARQSDLQHMQTMQVERQKLYTQAELTAAIQAIKEANERNMEEQRRQTEEQSKLEKRHFHITTALTVLSVIAALAAAIASIIAVCR